MTMSWAEMIDQLFYLSVTIDAERSFALCSYKPLCHNNANYAMPIQNIIIHPIRPVYFVFERARTPRAPYEEIVNFFWRISKAPRQNEHSLQISNPLFFLNNYMHSK